MLCLANDNNRVALKKFSVSDNHELAFAPAQTMIDSLTDSTRHCLDPTSHWILARALQKPRVAAIGISICILNISDGFSSQNFGAKRSWNFGGLRI